MRARLPSRSSINLAVGRAVESRWWGERICGMCRGVDFGVSPAIQCGLHRTLSRAECALPMLSRCAFLGALRTGTLLSEIQGYTNTLRQARR